jgi:hypothetical protein
VSGTAELLRDYRRVGDKEECPVCGHKGWCLVARDGSSAICQRVESPKKRRGAGYYHRLTDLPSNAPVRRPRAEPPVAGPTPAVDWEGLARACHGAIGTGRRELLAKSLSVAPSALDRLAYGWSEDRACFTTPVRDARGSVIGIQTRGLDGQKRMIKGSRQGLFVPDGLKGPGPLLICEGASDTAAALTLGFRALGRFSCTSGGDLLLERLQCVPERVVVVVSDSKPQEQEGAYDLARTLANVGRRQVKVLEMPPGVKDLRTWLSTGVTLSEVLRVVVCRFPS